MQPAPRPARRKAPALALAVLAVSFPFFVLVFIENPVTDALLSRLGSAALGRPVTFRQAHLELPSSLSFKEASLHVRDGWKPVIARQGKARLASGRVFLTVRELDLQGLGGEAGSGASDFIRRHGFEDWMIVRDSRWVLFREGEALHLGLLDSGVGGGSLKGGLRFEGERLARLNMAVWLPASLWSRFPDLAGKKFAEDAAGRRLFKLSWSNGRWMLWGRSAPVLEASWR